MSTASTRCRRASTSTSSGPQPREQALAAARAVPPRPAEPGRREPAPAGRGQRRAAGRVLRARRADRPLLREAAPQQGRRTCSSRRWSTSRRALVVVGFGDYRDELERSRRRGRSSPAPSSTGISSTCCRSATSRSCRRSSPRHSAWSPPRRRPPAARRSWRATRASRRSAIGLEEPSTGPIVAELASFRTGDAADLAAKLRAVLALPERNAGSSGCRPPGGRGALELASVAERLLAPSLTGTGAGPATWPRLPRPGVAPGRARHSGHRTADYASARGRRATPAVRRAAARRARAVRERGRLHPRGRGGVRDPRPGDAGAHQPLRAAEGRRAGHAARGAPGRRADRVRGRGAHRPLRDASRRPPRAMGERRAPAARAGGRARASSSAPPARTRGAPGRSSGSSTRRTTAATTRSCATSSGATTRSACTSTSAIRGADRAVRVTTRSATYLPDLLALSASSPFVENVNTGLHSARTQIFTRMFPRCGVPDALRRAGSDVRGLRAPALRDRLDRRAHAALVERPAAPRVPTVEMRICDAQPDLGRGALARARSATR